jgi:MazG family protein
MTEPTPARAGAAFTRLVALIARLRAPGGCPWDREQTHDSLKTTVIEEAYEVVEAIDGRDDRELAGELGDLLLQVVFHAQMAEERGAFTAAEVASQVADKMVRRHPHVFADDPAKDPDTVLRNWEAIKAKERADRGASDRSMLDSVSRTLPAVMEAFQISTKAARVGFDWPEPKAVLGKLDEETAELRTAVSAGGDHAAVNEEVGDLLFVAVNVARTLGVDPEAALKAANRKFRRRFGHLEDALRAQGRGPADASPAEMDALWEAAKRRERG